MQCGKTLGNTAKCSFYRKCYCHDICRILLRTSTDSSNETSKITVLLSLMFGEQDTGKKSYKDSQ